MTWQRWAEAALHKMDNPDHEYRDDETEESIASARRALECVRNTGYEPYYTLKAFVCLNNLEAE